MNEAHHAQQLQDIALGRAEILRLFDHPREMVVNVVGKQHLLAGVVVLYDGFARMACNGDVHVGRRDIALLAKQTQGRGIETCSLVILPRSRHGILLNTRGYAENSPIPIRVYPTRTIYSTADRSQQHIFLFLKSFLTQAVLIFR